MFAGVHIGTHPCFQAILEKMVRPKWIAECSNEDCNNRFSRSSRKTKLCTHCRRIARIEAHKVRAKRYKYKNKNQ